MFSSMASPKSSEPLDAVSRSNPSASDSTENKSRLLYLLINIQTRILRALSNQEDH